MPFRSFLSPIIAVAFLSLVVVWVSGAPAGLSVDSAGGSASACRNAVGPPLQNCRVLRNDTASNGGAKRLWGEVDCESNTRLRLVRGQGDPAPKADGGSQGNRNFRRLKVIDGDDVFGERCELARNEHRWGSRGGRGTFALFREGQRRITYFSVKLPRRYRLASDTWRVVMQMKQTQPSANGSGTPVLSLRTRDGRWQLLQSRSPGYSSRSRILWEKRARKRVWTRFAFDVTYSRKRSRGSVKVYADRNGDGDSRDRKERSRRIHTYTLKRETTGGRPDDRIAPGQSIPSHLRLGIYHGEAVKCPKPRGCSINVDNVQVLEPR